MKVLKAVWNWFANLFGLHRNSKYVKHYLNEANMRSGIYMAGVIVILEIWLVIRQHEKYIIPAVQSGKEYFDTAFTYTSLFWLLIFFGLSMFLYCLFLSKPLKMILTDSISSRFTYKPMAFFLSLLTQLIWK